MRTMIGVAAAIAVIIFGGYFLIEGLFSQETGAAAVWKRKQTLMGLAVTVFGILAAAGFLIVGFQDIEALANAKIVIWAQGIYDSIFSSNPPANLLP